MAQIRGKADVKPNKEMIRHMVLNSLRGFNVKFKEEFGDLVLCSDAGDVGVESFFLITNTAENRHDRTVRLIGIRYLPL